MKLTKIRMSTPTFFVFVCLFEIRNRIVPTGSTPKGGPTEITLYHPGHSSPPGLVSLSVPPPPPVLLSCILHSVRTLPCPPVLYIYPIQSLVCFFLVFLSYTYIQPHRKDNAYIFPFIVKSEYVYIFSMSMQKWFILVRIFKF